MLQDKHFESESANNGEDAIEMVMEREENPDCPC